MKTHRIFAVVAGFTTAVGFFALTVPASSAAMAPAGAAEVWRIVSSGGAHTCAIREDSTLWCWGNGSQGALGTGGEADENSPVQVVGDRTWSVVNTGLTHTCGVQSDGSLWCWGANEVGQLGVGDTGQRLVPTQVGTDDDWAAVSSGSEHTCAVKDDGTLWCWGGNLFGQLGQGNFQGFSNVPLQVGTSATWKFVRAGGFDTCALTNAADLFCWGANGFGQLGVGDTANRGIPVFVAGDYLKVSLTSNHTCAIQSTSDRHSRVSGKWHAVVLGTQQQGPARDRLADLPAQADPGWHGHGLGRRGSGPFPHLCDRCPTQAVVLGPQHVRPGSDWATTSPERCLSR